MNTKR